MKDGILPLDDCVLDIPIVKIEPQNVAKICGGLLWFRNLDDGGTLNKRDV